MKILALDPGVTTGWFFGDRKYVAYGQAQQHEIWELLDILRPSLLIVERFDFRPRDKVDLTPVKVIGIIEEWARQHTCPVDETQSLSQVQHFFTDARLKSEGYNFVGKPHAADAARHYHYYTKFRSGMRALLRTSD